MKFCEIYWTLFCGVTLGGDTDGQKRSAQFKKNAAWCCSERRYVGTTDKTGQKMNFNCPSLNCSNNLKGFCGVEAGIILSPRSLDSLAERCQTR